MNVRVLGRHFNYVVAPEIYFTQVHVWISMLRFVLAFSSFCSGTDDSYSLYSTHLTRSEFWVPARGIAYTNITHNVIPLSICKYTSFSKNEDDLFLQPVHLRSTRTKNNYHISHTISRSATIFQAEKAVPGVNDGFSVSKVVTSVQGKKEHKEHGKSPKNSMWYCKHC